MTNATHASTVDEIDSDWKMRVAQVRDAVLGWRARLFDPDDVVAGSPLAGDDKVFPLNAVQPTGLVGNQRCGRAPRRDHPRP